MRAIAEPVGRAARAARGWLLLAAALFAVLPLGGCLSRVIPEPPPPPLTYDFGPLPEEAPARLPFRFRLRSVAAPSWLETRSIYYRPLAEQPTALRPYAHNQWIASVPELFAERLGHRLAQASADAAARELPMRLEIVSFEHVYAAPDEAYVVARVRASYEDLDGRERFHAIERRRPAAAGVSGAIETLPRVADEVIDALMDWLRGETLDLDR